MIVASEWSFPLNFNYFYKLEKKLDILMDLGRFKKSFKPFFIIIYFTYVLFKCI